jgi:hypothetical protein
MSWWVDGPAAVDALHAVARGHGYTDTYPPSDEP